MNVLVVKRISQGRESDLLFCESDTMLRKRIWKVGLEKTAGGVFIRSSNTFIPISRSGGDAKPAV